MPPEADSFSAPPIESTPGLGSGAAVPTSSGPVFSAIERWDAESADRELYAPSELEEASWMPAPHERRPSACYGHEMKSSLRLVLPVGLVVSIIGSIGCQTPDTPGSAPCGSAAADQPPHRDYGCTDDAGCLRVWNGSRVCPANGVCDFGEYGDAEVVGECPPGVCSNITDQHSVRVDGESVDAGVTRYVRCQDYPDDVYAGHCHSVLEYLADGGMQTSSAGNC